VRARSSAVKLTRTKEPFFSPSPGNASAEPELIAQRTKTDFAMYPESTGSARKAKKHSGYGTTTIYQ
jgi:hypothetical protein